jgi:phospholipid/cholesterol/gamma-HCH transport system substrate-binding protein
MAVLEIKPTPAARIRVLGTISLAALICGVLAFLLTGGGRNFFEEKSTVYTFMPDVTGLAVSSEVRLNGIKVGAVKKIEISKMLENQRAVRVEMRVATRFLPEIPQDAQTSIGADTLIGYRFVDIDSSNKAKSPIAVAPGGTLESEPVQQAQDRANQVRLLQTELRQVDELLIQISSGETKIGQFVMGEKEYDDLLLQLTGFSKAVHAVVASDNPVGQALFSDSLYRKFREPLLRADETLAAIQRGEGAAGRMFASDEQYNAFLRNLRDLRAMLADAAAGKGRLGPMLRDEAGYEKLRKLLADTDAMIASLNAGEGKAGRLLLNAQLYESLNGSLRSMQDLLKDLREHPQKYLRYKLF